MHYDIQLMLSIISSVNTLWQSILLLHVPYDIPCFIIIHDHTRFHVLNMQFHENLHAFWFYTSYKYAQGICVMNTDFLSMLNFTSWADPRMNDNWKIHGTSPPTNPEKYFYQIIGLWSISGHTLDIFWKITITFSLNNKCSNLNTFIWYKVR